MVHLLGKSDESRKSRWNGVSKSKKRKDQVVKEARVCNTFMAFGIHYSVVRSYLWLLRREGT